MIRHLFFCILLLPLSAQGAHTSCQQQLTPPVDSKLIVMAPIGSLQDENRILNILDSESLKNGFESYFGIDFLEPFSKAYPTAQFRFSIVRQIGDGRIQIFLYEGRIVQFDRLSPKQAYIELQNGSESKRFPINQLVHFYIKMAKK